MPADRTIKQGDTWPPLTATLKDGSNAAINLTGATVTFFMVNKRSKAVTIQRVCTIVGDPLLGKVSMNWIAGDTDIVGNYDCEFRVIFGDGREATFPNSKTLLFAIVKELG